jgi:dihydropteroate synthase
MTTSVPHNTPPRADQGIRLLALPSPDAQHRELQRVGVTPAEAGRIAARGQMQWVRLEAMPADAARHLQALIRSIGGECTPTAIADTAGALDVVAIATPAGWACACARLQAHAGPLANTAQAIADALRAGAVRGALRCREFTLPLGGKTYVMGIINVTPDSFSGDGLGGEVPAAVRQAEAMLATGADLLDVGGESTRPGAAPVPLAEELRRVVPVIRALAPLGVPLSVDTYKSAVARAALDAGAALVNDISGLRFDPAMAGVAAAAGVPVIVMHLQGTPRTMQHAPHYDDLITEVCAELQAATARAESAGIPRDQIILDPGFGFGKTVAHNLALVRRLREFASTGQPLLLGPSRKATIGKLLGDLPPEERIEGTGALVALAIAHGVDIVRVHDVQAMVRVARVADAVVRGAE